MTYLLMRHKVRDFAAWKAGFDAHAPRRAEAGLALTHLLSSADEPNEVVGLFEAADLDRARAFCESADLRAAMQQAGVIAPPVLLFLNA